MSAVAKPMTSPYLRTGSPRAIDRVRTLWPYGISSMRATGPAGAEIVDPAGNDWRATAMSSVGWRTMRSDNGGSRSGQGGVETILPDALKRRRSQRRRSDRMTRRPGSAHGEGRPDVLV